jgi:hypothetical protein
MRRKYALVLAAVAVVALSGCGSAGDGKAGDGKAGDGTKAEGKVATLESAAPEATKASPKAQRPRERLDTTPEEFEAMLGPYNKCMREHGGAPKGDPGGNGSGPVAKPATKAQMDKYEAANRVCEPQYYPLPPWEKDPANPESRDFARLVVKCLKAKGVKYVEVADDGISIALGGDQNDPRSISLGLDKGPECDRQAAAEMKNQKK